MLFTPLHFFFCDFLVLFPYSLCCRGCRFFNMDFCVLPRNYQQMAAVNQGAKGWVLKYTVQNNGMFWTKESLNPEMLTSVDLGELRTNTDKVVNFLCTLSLSESRWVLTYICKVQKT